MRVFNKDGFEFIENGNDLFIRLTSAKIKEQLTYAEKNKVFGFNVTNSLGYLEKDLGFIDELNVEQIKQISLIFHNDVVDLSKLHKLKDLESLSINMPFNQKLDFSVFKNLKKCRIYWNSHIENIQNCSGLEELFITKLPVHDLNLLRSFPLLKRFGLDQSPIKDLVGVEILKELEYLSLGYLKNIESVECLGELFKLRSLRLYNLPKLKSINFLSKLNSLDKVYLDSLKNLEFVDDLIKLEEKVTFSISGCNKLSRLKS